MFLFLLLFRVAARERLASRARSCRGHARQASLSQERQRDGFVVLVFVVVRVVVSDNKKRP